MINVEKAVTRKFPKFASQPNIIRKPTVSLLKKLLYEDAINGFLENHKDARGFDFVDQVLDFFNFSYTVSARDKQHIPASGRVVIFANHPIGSLDGIAILRLIGDVRQDVRIVVNDMLSHFEGLTELTIPVDNMTGGSARRSIKAINQALQQEQAIIVFPAGEVSRAHPTGVKDTRWLPGFLHFARRAKAPLLPVHVHAKNSLLFYGASLLFKPLGTALLAHEMFNKRSHTIRFSIGAPIPTSSLDSQKVHDRTLVKRLKKHLYKVRKSASPIFETEKTIAHPEDRLTLIKELRQSKLLGKTRDNNHIYLVSFDGSHSIIREIGRLRELTFRKVGEGTGLKRDLDIYDKYYKHLVLWDAENLEIAGAYRLGEGKHLLKHLGEKGFYTRSLYTFEPAFHEYLEEAVELGRSFVNAKYWKKASLDYLWQGIGAYLAHNPDVRYLVGAVSMSADYPKALQDMLAYFYRRYYACKKPLAAAYKPYIVSEPAREQLDALFNTDERETAFEIMRKHFEQEGHKLPILFKQYTALFEPGGFQSIVFSVDPDFGDCLDGLCMSDLTKLKEKKRQRYIHT